MDVATQATTLWLKFDNTFVGTIKIRWEDHRNQHSTFESFKNNFLTGWGERTEPQPEWLVQDDEPAPDAKWNAAEEWK